MGGVGGGGGGGCWGRQTSTAVSDPEDPLVAGTQFPGKGLPSSGEVAALTLLGRREGAEGKGGQFPCSCSAPREERAGHSLTPGGSARDLCN